MAILTIHGSHRMQPSLMYYYHIDYMADSTIVFHVQYPHNVPIALLTIQSTYPRMLPSCGVFMPAVWGHASRVANNTNLFNFPALVVQLNNIF